MYKLKVEVSKPANYIYHMLSVSEVGYKNSYGYKYKSMHDKNDLAFLKKHENHLTVEGGRHCGKLYSLMVAKPAASRSVLSLHQYLESLIDLFTHKDSIGTASKYPDLDPNYLDDGFKSFEEVFEFCLNAFEEFDNEIIQISRLLIRNVNVYEGSIWDVESPILVEFRDKLMKEMESEKDLVSRWEVQLEKKLHIDSFEVVLVSSIEGGAQAIDISSSKDIFNVNNDIKDFIGFISHEIGIYILLQTLPMYMRENMQRYWQCIESLATYHNKKILYEDESLFAKDNMYFERFDKIYANGKRSSFIEIIEQASREQNSTSVNAV